MGSFFLLKHQRDPTDTFLSIPLGKAANFPGSLASLPSLVRSWSPRLIYGLNPLLTQDGHTNSENRTWHFNFDDYVYHCISNIDNYTCIYIIIRTVMYSIYIYNESSWYILMGLIYRLNRQHKRRLPRHIACDGFLGFLPKLCLQPGWARDARDPEVHSGGWTISWRWIVYYYSLLYGYMTYG